MRFAPGRRLGPYEIVTPIGAGGMGEVYQARDTRLDRIVAIKVLPEHAAWDPVLRERFEREARTISQLNHPHICMLYDVGREDGTDFLVMEYVDGQPLAARLAAGPLSVDQALRYALDIADALDKAHRRGIVHRDLKPGNVMLTKSGAKLLDFGLAKVAALKPGAPPIVGTARLQAGPTAAPTTPVTAQGTILGTFQYMAPEQLEGKEADARTDLFAFGAMLHEMITGLKAFDGTSQASVIAAILDRDPAPMSTLVPMAPPSLERVVKTCLAKDPDERFQSAHDMLLQLRWIAEGTPTTAALSAASTAETPHSRRRKRLWMAAGAVLLVAGIALAVTLYSRPAAPDAPEMRVDIVTPPTNDPISFAIAPDGRRLVFVASGGGASRLWLRPLDAPAAQPLAGTEGATYPFWSPDSRSVGFFADAKLKRIDIGGGPPQTVAEAPNGRGGTWSSNGVILFVPGTASPLFSVAASGGQATAVTTLDPPRQTSHRFPWFLPDGRQFLFYVFSGRPETQGIYLGSLGSPDTTRLGPADTAGVYAPPGWLLFNRQGTLVARRFDPSRREVSGDPVTVADPVGFDTGVSLSAVSVSAEGLVAYRAGVIDRRQLTWFDRSGKPLGTLGAPDENGLTAPTLAPDGRRVVAQRTVQGNVDIWLLDATRTTRVTFDANLDRFPIWSPDGSRIVFESNRKGNRNLYQKLSSGAGSDELLFESVEDKAANSFSPDGRFLLFSSIGQKSQTDMWVLPMEGERKPFVFVSTMFDERSGTFSPDGRWVAYMSNESGRVEIYVRPFPPGQGGQWQVSTAGGVQPRWRRDGKELYYIAPDGKLMAVPIGVSGTTLDPGTPVALFATRISGGPTNTGIRQQYDVAADGRFLINVTADDAPTSPITLLLNWKASAKR